MISTQLHSKIDTWAFWRFYIIQMRPYLFFISGIAGLSGMVVSEHFSFNKLYNVFALLGFFLSYGFGQALTDCYQMDTDKISAPYRPLCQGKISMNQVKVVSIIGLLCVTSVLVFPSWINALLCLLSVFGLWSYTYIKKNFWFAGPFYNAWIVALLVLMGYIATTGVGIIVEIDVNVLKAMLITFLSYSNFVLIGYLKDISADSKTNYKTFPVVLGWNKTVWAGDQLYLVQFCAFLLLFPQNTLSYFFGGLSFLTALSGQIYAHLVNKKVEINATFPILSTVRSFLLIHFATISVFNPELWIFCLIFYLSFELVVYVRPVKMQI